jgi:predicted lipid carrier protein YhbT
MKVTALIPDDLVNEVVELSHASNITEALKTALSEWVKIKKLKELNLEVKDMGLDFEYSAEKIRDNNRK